MPTKAEIEELAARQSNALGQISSFLVSLREQLAEANAKTEQVDLSPVVAQLEKMETFASGLTAATTVEDLPEPPDTEVAEVVVAEPGEVAEAPSEVPAAEVPVPEEGPARVGEESAGPPGTVDNTDGYLTSPPSAGGLPGYEAPPEETAAAEETVEPPAEAESAPAETAPAETAPAEAGPVAEEPEKV